MIPKILELFTIMLMDKCNMENKRGYVRIIGVNSK